MILVLQPVVEGTEITDEQLAQTVEIIRARWTAGRRRGRGDHPVREIRRDRRLGPGLKTVVELVQRTALLNFRPVWNVLSPFPIDPADADADAGTPPRPRRLVTIPRRSASDGGAQSAEIVQAPDYSPEFQAEVDALDCLDPVNLAGGTPDDPTEWLGACDQSGGQKYVMEPAFIEGVSVTDANAQLTQQGIGWVVTLEFDSEGAGASPRRPPNSVRYRSAVPVPPPVTRLRSFSTAWWCRPSFNEPARRASPNRR